MARRGQVALPPFHLPAELEPALYWIFTQAVLAEHPRARNAQLGLDWCMACGCARVDCPVWALASRLGVAEAEPLLDSPCGRGEATALMWPGASL
jgi:hypothetical protein